MANKEIEIKHVIVHISNKEQGEPTSVDPSPAEGQVTEASQRLIDDICERYAGRAGKGYGHFEDDHDSYPMSTIISDYIIHNTDDFYACSCRMVNHLSVRSSDQHMATGGYVLFAHIEVDQHEHMLVAVVTATIGSVVEGFDIRDSTYLDIAKLRVAGRIDLTAWQNGTERYISFLKGQDSVSSYFKKFLGCNDVISYKL